MAYGNHKNNNQQGRAQAVNDAALARYGEMLAERIKEMEKSHWQQGWLEVGSNGLPQNISGRRFNGSNHFFLLLHSMMNGFSMPVYMTFLQAKELGLKVNKGAQSMPVVHWCPSIRDGEGMKVSQKDYDAMSDSEKERCSVRLFPKVYPEFNVDHTNLQEVHPELYDKLKARLGFSEPPLVVDGMYANAAIDRMLERQEWVCPVKYDEFSNKACYHRVTDDITIPRKSQFRRSETVEGIYQDGMEWYSTFIHEAAHSTGAESRLNRRKGEKFGDAAYAREELVAEMTAAVVGSVLGFSYRVQDNNVQYMGNWAKSVKNDPEFLSLVVKEVGQASNMFLDKLNEQKIALGETPIIDSSPVMSQQENRNLRLEALEKSCVDAIVSKASDVGERHFSEAQKVVFEDYIREAIERGPDGVATAEERGSLLRGLFEMAKPKMMEQRVMESWQDSVRDELDSLAQGLSVGSREYRVTI